MRVYARSVNTKSICLSYLLAAGTLHQLHGRCQPHALSWPVRQLDDHRMRATDPPGEFAERLATAEAKQDLLVKRTENAPERLASIETKQDTIVAMIEDASRNVDDRITGFEDSREFTEARTDKLWIKFRFR